MGTAPVLVGDVVDTTPTPTVARAEMALSREQVELIKRTVCKGATDDELDFFLNAARRLGLDPLARQIHAVKRWDSSANREVMAIQVAIDGLRIIAARTGKYRGQTPAEWCGDDGAWRDAWLRKDAPAAARVGVMHADFAEPLVCVARYGAYVQTKKGGEPNSMWARMPDIMLAKCAEGLALRKAFPQDLAGVYAPEEMGQADTGQDERKRITQPRRASARVEGEPARALPSADANPWRGSIASAEEQPAEGSAKPWMLITGDDGVTFSTFDTKLWAAANELLGQPAVIAWKQSGEWRKATSIAAGSPEEPGSDG